MKRKSEFNGGALGKGLVEYIDLEIDEEGHFVLTVDSDEVSVSGDHCEFLRVRLCSNVTPFQLHKLANIMKAFETLLIKERYGGDDDGGLVPTK